MWIWGSGNLPPPPVPLYVAWQASPMRNPRRFCSMSDFQHLNGVSLRHRLPAVPEPVLLDAAWIDLNDVRMVDVACPAASRFPRQAFGNKATLGCRATARQPSMVPLSRARCGSNPAPGFCSTWPPCTGASGESPCR